jgi:osmoprotectant transport system ATP-binding protein
MNDAPDHRPVIQFQNVSYRLENGLELLHNLSLEVERGETLVLLGRSGSGKTTTLKLINHLLSPSGGEVLVDGRSLREWDLIRLRRIIGYVIQEVGLFPHFSIERNIALVPQLERWPVSVCKSSCDWSGSILNWPLGIPVSFRVDSAKE